MQTYTNGFLLPPGLPYVKIYTDFSTDMIPSDSRVEIDAKINAGYFTTGKQYTEEDLKQIKGRGWQGWEDVAH